MVEVLYSRLVLMCIKSFHVTQRVLSQKNDLEISKYFVVVKKSEAEISVIGDLKSASYYLHCR